MTPALLQVFIDHLTQHCLNNLKKHTILISSNYGLFAIIWICDSKDTGNKRDVDLNYPMDEHVY